MLGGPESFNGPGPVAYLFELGLSQNNMLFDLFNYVRIFEIY